MKPNFNDIKALIEQAEKLKQEVEHLKEKSFLTQVQSKAIKAGTDTALYLLRLSHTNEEECLNNFGIVDNYFVPTGSVNKGRFAQNLRLPSAVDYRREEPERIEWYNPKKHTGLVVRYDFDEKKFWHFLNQYKAKQRQLYWKNHIQPLIVQLDTDLTPWLPFMKPYIDTERIQKAINTAEAGTLSDAIYEFKKIQKVVETEVKQEPAKEQLPSGEKADLASTKQNGKEAKSQKAKKKPDYTHSEDFTSVVWYGKSYQFTKTQALCVKHLWAEWEKSEGLGLSEKTIGEKIGSSADNYKLKHTFRVKHNNKSCQHPAWGKMIVSCGKGMFCLKSSRKK